MRYVCVFFQAEDGIRDAHVTGVQTCALPILARVFQQDLLQYSQLLEDLLQYSQLLEDILQYSLLLADLLQYSQSFSQISYNILSLSRRSPTIFSAFLEDLLQYSQPF